MLNRKPGWNPSTFSSNLGSGPAVNLYSHAHFGGKFTWSPRLTWERGIFGSSISHLLCVRLPRLTVKPWSMSRPLFPNGLSPTSFASSASMSANDVDDAGDAGDVVHYGHPPKNEPRIAKLFLASSMWKGGRRLEPQQGTHP